jgi:hypothetical protein
MKRLSMQHKLLFLKLYFLGPAALEVSCFGIGRHWKTIHDTRGGRSCSCYGMSLAGLLICAPCIVALTISLTDWKVSAYGYCVKLLFSSASPPQEFRRMRRNGCVYTVTGFGGWPGFSSLLRQGLLCSHHIQADSGSSQALSNGHPGLFPRG